MSGPEQVSVVIGYELQRVTWTYAHRIEHVAGRVTWRFEVILTSKVFVLFLALITSTLSDRSNALNRRVTSLK